MFLGDLNHYVRNLATFLERPCGNEATRREGEGERKRGRERGRGGREREALRLHGDRSPVTLILVFSLSPVPTC